MIGSAEQPGISVLTINDMFSEIASDPDNHYEIKVSYVEIYNEVIWDLLTSNFKESVLDLRDDPMKGVKLAGVTEFTVEDTS